MQTNTIGLHSLLDEAVGLLSEKLHSPFKKFKKLGDKSPSERKGPDQVGDWDCNKKGKYVQVCKGVGPDTEGRKKIVRIDPDYKSSYNADYKAGVSTGKYKPGARSGAAKKAKKAAAKAKAVTKKAAKK